MGWRPDNWLRRWRDRRMAAVPSRQLKQFLLGAPLGVCAIGVGFLAQSFRPAPPIPDDRVLDALLPAVTEPAKDQAVEERRLEAIEARRAEPAPSAPGLPDGAATLVEPAPGQSVALEIRVALLRQVGQPSLTATGPWTLRSSDGDVLLQGAAQTPLALAALPAGANGLWLSTTAGSALLVNGQAYEGRIRLLRTGDGLTPVNHLPLERYLMSVVGAEMPSSWSIQALKAQAVAARSYALAHMARPADPHWHLGDTTRWQAYRGLASVTDRTAEAVRRTDGLILSYQGGIVESLYAANSQITVEAHGHLGASMSQEGAQELALSGLTYNQILGRYYQGASLARLQIGAKN
ncbi:MULTISPECIES: SpoIID/LytB domain-containing protein [Synechococcaceae]|uniref:SpoIID/LytB domain-containing protein n=1 Tax=Synechococcaceae TaxID=1890426 RepID=UPI00223A70E3|nr:MULTISPECIES: SpoIID/LytB domain-containing protein [Synechococcaceae]MCT4367126.1 SpoIID/LytB domain-containing protein [Candidatus Regnicoccus frigidus MAG-AL2]